jgi:anti-anti-sigma factor
MAAEQGEDVSLRRRDGVAIIELGGEIDARADQPIADAYAEACESGCHAIVLNFGQTSYINSTGIALLVGLLARARAERQRVLAYGLSDHYRQIFEITRLVDFMRITSDEEGAVEAAARRSDEPE